MSLVKFGDGAPISASGAGGTPKDEVLDLGLYFGSVTLLLELVAFENAGGSAAFTLRMETAMRPDASEWETLDTFASITPSNKQDKDTFTGLLRYVRWYVVSITDATKVFFLLTGVARNP